MTWQSLLKTFTFNESEDTSVQLVNDWKESLYDVMVMWEESQGAGYVDDYLHLDRINSLTEIYAIVLDEIRQTEEYLSWDWSEQPNAAEQIRFFERYLRGLEQLKEDMEWNFGDN